MKKKIFVSACCKCCCLLKANGEAKKGTNCNKLNRDKYIVSHGYCRECLDVELSNLKIGAGV